MAAVALVGLAALAAPAAPKPVLFGFDMVEYFTKDAAANGTMGMAEFAHTIESFDFTTHPPTSVGNYTFLFNNEANMAAFAADPWKFAPRWGGF